MRPIRWPMCRRRTRFGGCCRAATRSRRRRPYAGRSPTSSPATSPASAGCGRCWRWTGSARKLVDGLLVNYAAGDPRPPELEKPYWQAAFELCGSFGEAHGYFLRCMRTRLLFQGWREYLPFVALRLFQHRQMELLLRPFADDRFAPICWKDVHEVYRFAESRKLLHEPLPVYRCHSQQKAETTLEREYIHVLLQNLINDAQFPPYDAFWVGQNIPRWCHALALQPHQADATDRTVRGRRERRRAGSRGHRANRQARASASTRFRSSSRCARNWRRCAMRPNPPAMARRRGAGGSSRCCASSACSVRRSDPVIVRRGERKPAAVTVEVVSGIPEIAPRAARHSHRMQLPPRRPTCRRSRRSR